MSREVSVEATAWKNVEAALALALESFRKEKVTSSNDVSVEAFGGKRALRLVDVSRLSVRSFDAQAVYAFARSGLA